MSRILLASVATALALAALPASAQPYPNRPVTLVVPFPPGGSTSIVARIVADKMSEALGQSIVIDNRGGAGGTVGTRAVAKSPPDGYTLLLGYTGTLAIGPTLYPSAGYDPRKDFAPVGLIGHAPNSLVVHPSFPVKSVQELIAYVKANPGKVNYGSAGVGTVSHVSGEYFASAAGIKLVHVPYRGTGPALNDLVAGHVDLIFMELSAAYKLHDGGKARILAVATDKRIDLLKDMPTMMEVGVPDFTSDTWNAISAPPRTPAPIIAKLNRTMNDIIKADDMKKRFVQLNLIPVGGSPEDMRKLVNDETRRWGEVIKKAGIQPQ
jgi:tripartite-type tricarboxylate transporter receptor subunit TctC